MGWQCRVRQHAVRKARGRPSAGMRPSIRLAARTLPSAITTVLNKSEPGDSTVEFKHIVKKTHDPRLRAEAGLQKLQVNYFHPPRSFSDCLTATFSPGSTVAEVLLEAPACRLIFAQSNQRFEMQVSVKALAEDDAFFQATFWHNAMFNPNLSLDHTVLMFTPDWERASADPTPFP